MIICDIDGCLFSNEQRAHLIPDDRDFTPNWDSFNKACHDDKPVMPIIKLVKHLAKMAENELHRKVVFVTSRAESARVETLTQLKNHFPSFQIDLFMRQMDDHRSTIDYKREVFHQLSDNFQKDSVLIDDHPGIMEMVKIHYPMLNRLLVPSFDCTVMGDGQC